MSQEKICNISIEKILEVLADENILIEKSSRKYAEKYLKKVVKIEVDSRKTGKDDCFIAVKGSSFDGHHFISEVVKKDPSVVIFEEKNGKPNEMHSKEKILWVPVINSRKMWSLLAAKSFGNPEKSLNIYGVTGTNGKTSTVWMTREILEKFGEKSTIVGTLGAWVGDEFIETNHTTPDPVELFSIISLSKNRGVKNVIMEVSSHSLDQEKVAPIIFQGAAFTSFSRDHLDYHIDMEEYLRVKWRLFSERLQKNGLCLFSQDVFSRIKKEELEKIKKKFDPKIIVYGSKNKKINYQNENVEEVVFKNEKSSYLGSEISIERNNLLRKEKIPFFGNHAIENFICAVNLAEHVLNRLIITDTWESLSDVPGRLELVSRKENEPIIFVDYAHTPDGLEKTLYELKKICFGRLWAVFGCGGDRDKGKRPEMGKIAERLADQIIITSDNPRTEDAESIIEDVLEGIENKKRCIVEKDRKKAIEYAIKNYKKNDVIVLAGKGHENYQIIGKEKIKFDDRIIAREIIDSLNKKKL